MKISGKLGVMLSVVFAAVCLAVAIKGFLSLDEIDDAIVLADSKGYAWYWMFLAFVGAVFGVLSWWAGRNLPGDPDA